MSQLDRLTGIKNLRVRGLFAVSFAAYLKAAGINIIRAAAFRRRKNEGNSTPDRCPFDTILCCQRAYSPCFSRRPVLGRSPVVQYTVYGYERRLTSYETITI